MMTSPPRFKVIDTPEEAAQALQHQPDIEKHCEILQLKSLKVTERKNVGGGSSDMPHFIMTPELSAMNGGGGENSVSEMMNYVYQK